MVTVTIPDCLAPAAWGLPRNGRRRPSRYGIEAEWRKRALGVVPAQPKARPGGQRHLNVEQRYVLKWHSDHARAVGADRCWSSYIGAMATKDEVITFYETHYDMLGSWLLRPGDKIMLGDKTNRVCRFCGKSPPDAKFRKVAHAIPEALGNKSLESAYECDACNERFGQGIENDLGNWSKPMRTFARIRGKSGVPTLKKGGDEPGWRIEYGDTGFNISSYEDDPLYEIDEANKKITFKLKRDAYTPVAVLKAFMKIGLTLLPDIEIVNFQHLMSWVRDTDHSRPFADQCPIIYSFQPGPMPNDLIAAFILRRKPHVTGYAYAYLVLGYGNEVFQVQLPSEKHDGAMNGRPISIHPFPTPGSPDPARFGPSGRALLDFTGREVVRGEVVPITVGFEQSVRTGADIADT
ncbi:HNH endonuclease [Nitrobacter sp.]|uniref:HNH endonuclease n=1 Tax=Alphaproteobacteria TaxID=28211 RepID=UPI0028E27243|nr:HNH endonuclease [Nitrobacter sp.]